MLGLWVIWPCSLVEVYQFFDFIAALMMEAVNRLKRWYTSTRLYGAATQKTVIFLLSAVRTLNSTDIYYIPNYEYRFYTRLMLTKVITRKM